MSTLRRRFKSQQQQQPGQDKQWHDQRRHQDHDNSPPPYQQYHEPSHVTAALSAPPQSRPKSLDDLPVELHLLVLQHLSYPDTLALKLTCHHFHRLISPMHTVVSRVTWLLGRACAGLPIPKTSQVRMHNDEVFVSNPEVREILKGRLGHRECIVSWRGWKSGRNRRRWEGCCLERERGEGTDRLCDGVVESGGNDPWTRLVERRTGLELDRVGESSGWRGRGMCFAPSIECRRERIWEGVGLVLAVAAAVFACWMAVPSSLLSL